MGDTHCHIHGRGRKETTSITTTLSTGPPLPRIASFFDEKNPSKEQTVSYVYVDVYVYVYALRYTDDPFIFKDYSQVY